MKLTIKLRPTLRSTLAAVLLPASLMLGACSGTTGSNADIKAREDVMKNWKDAMGIMGGMMKQPDTFNAEIFAEQAAFLASDADSPWSHFSNADEQGGSTPAVWSDAAGFQAEIDKFKSATAALDSAAQSATSAEQVKDAFGAVGGSCKSCHQSYKADN